MNNIVVVGSCMIDFISYAQRLPTAGETILGTKFTTGFGGKGANQCVAAAKLGGKTIFITRLGDDTWSLQYLKTLNDLHVDTSHVQITKNCSSGLAQITVDDCGQNQIVVVGGANEKLSKSDIDTARDTIINAGVLVCQLEVPMETVLNAIDICKGVTILNAAPAVAEYDTRLFTLPSIFCVNETEASVFTNLPVNNLEEAKVAVQELLKRGCNNVILTLGAQGVLQASKVDSNIIHIPSVVVTPVDTTGAGDAFIGALAYLISERSDLVLRQQMELACCMAANSVTKPGTQTSFPDHSVLIENLHLIKKKCN